MSIATIKPVTITVLAQGMECLASQARAVGGLLAELAGKLAHEAHEEAPPVTYRGRRLARDVGILTRIEAGAELALSPRAALEWGYLGQGPLTLAGALLADACGPEAAADVELVWHFCEAWISHLPREGWESSAAEIRAVARSLGWKGQALASP